MLGELRARRIQVLNQGEEPDRPDLSVVITFDVSYDDLDADDQARLRKPGVFARNEFELPALQAAWEDEESSARGALERLANAGLAEETGQETWWMHDLLRELVQGENVKREDVRGDADTAYRHFLLWQVGQVAQEIRVLFDPDTLPSRLSPHPRALNDLLAMLNQRGLAEITAGR